MLLSFQEKALKKTCVCVWLTDCDAICNSQTQHNLYTFSSEVFQEHYMFQSETIIRFTNKKHMREITSKYVSVRGAPFFNCFLLQKFHTIMEYVCKLSEFCTNYYSYGFHFLEGSRCVKHGGGSLPLCLSSARERIKTALFIGLICVCVCVCVCLCVYGARICQPTDF